MAVAQFCLHAVDQRTLFSSAVFLKSESNQNTPCWPHIKALPLMLLHISPHQRCSGKASTRGIHNLERLQSAFKNLLTESQKST